MSCDNSLKTFCTHMAAVPPVAAALGGGSAATAAEVMEEIVELSRARVKPLLDGRRKAPGVRDKLADLTATAQCSTLFSRMADLGIKPPAHGKANGGMPFPLPADKDAIYGYAALETVIAAAAEGRTLPDLAREVVAATTSRARPTLPAQPTVAAPAPTAPDWRAPIRDLVARQPGILDAANGDPRVGKAVGVMLSIGGDVADLPNVPPELRDRVDALRTLGAGDTAEWEPAYQALGIALAEVGGATRCQGCGQYTSPARPHDCPVAGALAAVPAMATTHGDAIKLDGRARNLLRPLVRALEMSPGADLALVFAARQWVAEEARAGALSRPWASLRTAQLALALADATNDVQILSGTPREVASALLAAVPDIRDIAHADMLFDPVAELRASLALARAAAALAGDARLGPLDRADVAEARSAYRSGSAPRDGGQALAAVLERLADAPDAGDLAGDVLTQTGRALLDREPSLLAIAKTQNELSLTTLERLARMLSGDDAPAQLRAPSRALLAALEQQGVTIEAGTAAQVFAAAACRAAGLAHCPECGYFMSETAPHDCPVFALRTAGGIDALASGASAVPLARGQAAQILALAQMYAVSPNAPQAVVVAAQAVIADEAVARLRPIPGAATDTERAFARAVVTQDLVPDQIRAALDDLVRATAQTLHGGDLNSAVRALLAQNILTSAPGALDLAGGDLVADWRATVRSLDQYAATLISLRGPAGAGTPDAHLAAAVAWLDARRGLRDGGEMPPTALPLAQILARSAGRAQCRACGRWTGADGGHACPVAAAVPARLDRAAAGDLAGLHGLNQSLSAAAASVLAQPQADETLKTAARMWQAAASGRETGRYPGLPTMAYRVWAGALGAALRGQPVSGIVPGDPPYRAISRGLLDNPDALAIANGTRIASDSIQSFQAATVLRTLEIGPVPSEIRALAEALRDAESPGDGYMNARRNLVQALCRDAGYSACLDCGQFMSRSSPHACPSAAARVAFAALAPDDDAWRTLEQVAGVLAWTPGRPDLAAAARRFIREGTLATESPATAAFLAALRGEAPLPAPAHQAEETRSTIARLALAQDGLLLLANGARRGFDVRALRQVLDTAAVQLAQTPVGGDLRRVARAYRTSGDHAAAAALAQALCRAAGLGSCSICGCFIMSSTASHDCPIAARGGDADIVALAGGQPWARTEANLAALGEVAATVLESPAPRPALAQAAREARDRLGQAIEAGDVPWQLTQLALAVEDAARGSLPTSAREIAAALLERASYLRAVAAGAHVVEDAPSRQAALHARLALIEAAETLAEVEELTIAERARTQIARDSLRAGFTNAQEAQALAALLVRLDEEDG